MENKGNRIPPKEHNNFPATDPKEIKTLVLPGNCFKEAELTAREKKEKQEYNPVKSEKQHMNKTCLIEKQK